MGTRGAMVCGKLFGWGKKDEDGGASTPHRKCPQAGWRRSIRRGGRCCARSIKQPDLVPAKSLIVKALYKRDLDEVRRYLQAVILP